MITIENDEINKIPFLHITNEKNKAEKLPLIIFVHGFTSVKENNLHYAYLLAQKGFRVLLPEALYHGERNPGLSGHSLNIHFWEIVLQSIQELDLLKRSFEERELIDPDRIGVVGTSMGGIVTLGALTKYNWIKAATSLMGMPYYEKLALKQLDDLKKNGLNIPITEDELSKLMDKLRELDLSLQPEKLYNRPLLFWHGKKDSVVPYEYSYRFYEKIKPLYEQHPDRLQFITDLHAGHKVSNDGVLKTVNWFETYI